MGIMDVESLHGDEYYTQEKDAETIAQHIIRPMNVWCPFDQEWSVWIPVLKRHGHKVVATSTDFFTTDPPPGTEAIISNPPFSRKKDVVKRIDELGLKFALILPYLWLNDGVPLDYGHQIMLFRKRMQFIYEGGGTKTTTSKLLCAE